MRFATERDTAGEMTSLVTGSISGRRDGNIDLSIAIDRIAQFVAHSKSMTINQAVLSLAGLMVTLFTIFAGFFKYYLDAKIEAVRAEIKAEGADLRTEMKAMELRLNERIDSRLIHR